MFKSGHCLIAMDRVSYSLEAYWPALLPTYCWCSALNTGTLCWFSVCWEGCLLRSFLRSRLWFWVTGFINVAPSRPELAWKDLSWRCHYSPNTANTFSEILLDLVHSRNRIHHPWMLPAWHYVGQRTTTQRQPVTSNNQYAHLQIPSPLFPAISVCAVSVSDMLVSAVSLRKCVLFVRCQWLPKAHTRIAAGKSSCHIWTDAKSTNCIWLRVSLRHSLLVILQS